MCVNLQQIRSERVIGTPTPPKFSSSAVVTAFRSRTNTGQKSG